MLQYKTEKYLIQINWKIIKKTTNKRLKWKWNEIANKRNLLRAKKIKNGKIKEIYKKSEANEKILSLKVYEV